MVVIKQYEKYIENLKYFIFDVDDNLLILNTPLHFQHFENGVWKNKNITSAMKKICSLYKLEFHWCWWNHEKYDHTTIK